MKKIIFLFSVLLLSFLSCSKDEENESLNNTVWICTSLFDGYEGVGTLTFYETTFDLLLEMEDEDGSLANEFISGQYTYNHPNIVLTANDGESETATRSGNKIIFQNEDGVSLVFTKK
jgi:hypothetical protein